MKIKLNADEIKVATLVLGADGRKVGISEIAREFKMSISYVHAVWVRFKQKSEQELMNEEIRLISTAWEGSCLMGRML